MLAPEFVSVLNERLENTSPENDGWLALVDQDDLDHPLTKIWGDDAYSFIDIPWEVVTRRDGMFLAFYLANNQFGVMFIVPENIVHGELLDCLKAHLVE